MPVQVEQGLCRILSDNVIYEGLLGFKPAITPADAGNSGRVMAQKKAGLRLEDPALDQIAGSQIAAPRWRDWPAG